MLICMSSGSQSSTGPTYSVSVAGAVVRTDGRVLAIQRADNGHWELPGGVLELDESPQAGACREILEETGVRVEVGDLTGVYKNMLRHVVALVFKCRPIGGVERTSAESLSIAWLTPEEITATMSEAYAVRILDALSDEAPFVRSHDGKNLLTGAL